MDFKLLKGHGDEMSADLLIGLLAGAFWGFCVGVLIDNAYLRKGDGTAAREVRQGRIMLDKPDPPVILSFNAPVEVAKTTMNEMIGKVLYDHYADPGDIFYVGEWEPGLRDIFAALRNPTSEMIAAVTRQTHPASFVLADWQTMIDVAFKGVNKMEMK